MGRMVNEMNVIRRCRHCGERYESNPDYDPPDAWNYCGPDCHYAHEIEPDIKRQEARESAIARKDNLLQDCINTFKPIVQHHGANCKPCNYCDLIARIRKEVDGE